MRSRWITGGDSCTICVQNCGDACGECKPGMKRPVQAKEEMSWQIRSSIQKRDVDRKIVGKYMSHVPRKAAIVYTVPVP